jgi:glycosyltransferase involved in cell wall biosynthesis
MISRTKLSQQTQVEGTITPPAGRETRRAHSRAARPSNFRHRIHLALKVAVFTTSYPRDDEDFAGRFVADLVEHLRARDVEINVVGPDDYRGFGRDAGVVAGFKRKPWLAPVVIASMGRALRKAARDADLVHAHWLASMLVAPAARRPIVLTLHGSGTAGRLEDLKLMAKAPRLARSLLRRARVVVGVSEQLTEAAQRSGALDARWIPNGVEIPPEIGEEADPPEVLFVGRLSPEKGISELVGATRGLNLVVAGDGPLRHLVPGTLGFVAPAEVQCLMARAAVVVLPSHREGLPMVLLEAMAHGRAVVATPVGGTPTLVEDGVTGLLVPVGDTEALREAVTRLLGNPALRRKLGRAGRAKVQEVAGWERVTEATLDAYASALR